MRDFKLGGRDLGEKVSVGEIGVDSPDIASGLTKDKGIGELQKTESGRKELSWGKSRTAFMQSQFRAMRIPRTVPAEVRLSRTFTIRDMLVQSRAPKQEVQVNAAYKRKADKVQPVNYGKSTGEKPGGIPN